MTLPDDISTWLYMSGFLIKGYGFCLFAWWWRKAKTEDAHVSTVFIYITAILLASFIRDGIEMYGGYCRSTVALDMEQMREWVYDTWFWPMRMVVVNVAFLVLIVHMSVRAFIQRKR